MFVINLDIALVKYIIYLPEWFDGPLVLQVTVGVSEAPDLEGTVLGVEGELLEVHPTLGGDRQPLGERDTTVRGDPDEPGAAGVNIVTKIV